MARFPPLLQSPQPQTQEVLWFLLPSPGSPYSTQTGTQLRPPEAASGVFSDRRKGVSTFRCRRFWASSFPSHISPMPLCFRRGKLPTCTPSPTRPPVRPSPAGNPSAGTPSNQRLALTPGQPLRNRKQRGSGMGQRPHPGRRVFPTTASSPAPPSLGSAHPAGPPLRAAERPLPASGGTYRCGARAAGRGRAGPVACRAQVRPGAPSTGLAPAPPPAPGLGALSCAACSPPPRSALKLPPHRVVSRASPTPPGLPRRV